MANYYSSAEFERKYTYEGDDLGLTVGDEELQFKLWAPEAGTAFVNIYASGDPEAEDFLERYEMAPEEKGVFSLKAGRDLLGKYYTYTVVRNGKGVEAVDPYARTTGVNGFRAMILDLATTNPAGWEEDRNPHANEKITDAIIYELHVRDLSMDESSGIQHKGKYLGLTETGTKTPEGKATGLDHIRELGVTHIHLLPIYDYGSLDERDDKTFAWGYDPANYNVPEGSYATDPYHGEVRVKELKTMIKTLHDNSIAVIMDVVYNHVYDENEFCVNKLVPGYFSRINDYGKYSNGSVCGNDTASERSMVRKYIVDSVLYWAKEYHMDGFRFDLVGLLDIETINEIIRKVHEIRPDIFFYGEGWQMGTEVTKNGVELVTQGNAAKTPEFAFFNDRMRDGVKGHVFDEMATGYVSGANHATFRVGNSWTAKEEWCSNPSQIVQYVSCHDNYTLYDKLTISTPWASADDRVRMNNLAAAIYLTAQGVPLMQAGEEMLRSKRRPDGSFEHNSYASPDAVNSLKWYTLADTIVAKTFAYYKGLIAFRKAHPSLHMETAKDVSTNVSPRIGLGANVLAFYINPTNGETAEEIFVAFNPNAEAAVIDLKKGNWNVYVDAERAGTTPLYHAEGGKVTVAPISAVVLVREDKAVGEDKKEAPATSNDAQASTEATASASNDVHVSAEAVTESDVAECTKAVAENDAPECTETPAGAAVAESDALECTETLAEAAVAESDDPECTETPAEAAVAESDAPECTETLAEASVAESDAPECTETPAGAAVAESDAPTCTKATVPENDVPECTEAPAAESDAPECTEAAAVAGDAQMAAAGEAPVHPEAAAFKSDVLVFTRKAASESDVLVFSKTAAAETEASASTETSPSEEDTFGEDEAFSKANGSEPADETASEANTSDSADEMSSESDNSVAETASKSDDSDAASAGDASEDDIASAVRSLRTDKKAVIGLLALAVIDVFILGRKK